MPQGNEKVVFVHWYYSVSEWKDFTKREKGRQRGFSFPELVLVVLAGLFVIYFGRNISLAASVAMGTGLAFGYYVIKYYIQTSGQRWKGPGMPEISITDKAVTANGKITVFQGNGNWFRTVDIKENDNINILRIMYERNTGERTYYNEIRVPVPKGKLREAVVLLDSLTLRWSAMGN